MCMFTRTPIFSVISSMAVACTNIRPVDLDPEDDRVDEGEAIVGGNERFDIEFELELFGPEPTCSRTAIRSSKFYTQ